VSGVVINKKECRKYFDPGIKLKSESGVFHYKKIEYIACTALKNIGGRRMLLVYFYNRKKIIEGCTEPEFTLFQCKDDYIILHKENSGNYKWRSASLYNLRDRYTNFTEECAFYELKDELRVVRFCNITDKSGFEALNSYQSAIMCTRLTKRVITRESKIIERMNTIPSELRGLKSWVKREVLPHYIFYDYRRGNKPKKGYCTACWKDVIAYGTKHNLNGKCPNCGKNVVFKSSGIAKRVWDRTTVQVIQKTSKNELVLRIYKVNNGLRNYREPDFRMWESTRVFIRKGDLLNMDITQYYNSYGSGILTTWKKGVHPRFSYYQYNFECDLCGHLYCANLDDVLKGTKLQYSQLKRFYSIDAEPLEVISYLQAYENYPAIEYLVKLGLTNLAASIIYERDGAKNINESGKNLRETLGVEPADIPLLQKLNVNNRQFELFKKFKKQGIKADESLLVWFKEHEIASAENILIPLRYTTPKKLMRYIEEQFINHKEVKQKYGGPRYHNIGGVLSDYKDYLYMSGFLEYDMKNDFVLFPKNLHEAHDQASEMFNGRKSEIFNKAIRSVYDELKDKYSFTRDGLTLIPPKTAKEIVKEGHTLHHCVNSYLEKVAKGKCLVLFIRQTDNIKKPFYTVEIQDDRVIQIQGMHHCNPTPEVKKFLEIWKRKKLMVA